MEIEIQNIAGIRSGKADIQPGLNVVKAQNWQGKSSFMTAIQVVMGTTGWDGEEHPLTDGSAEGNVRLTTDADTYVTELVRSGNTVRRDGNIYIESNKDRICARLFAFLGENNPVREVVRMGGDLASLLTRPLDIDNIDEQVAQFKRERRSVENELERARDAADRVTRVQSNVTQLQQDIEDLQGQRDELQTEDDSAGDSQSQEQLSDLRAKKEQLTHQINTTKNKIDRQRLRLQDRQEKLEDLSVPDEPEFTADIEKQKQRLTTVESDITLLQDLYRVNKRVLDEGKAELVTDIERTLAEDKLNCWLCGDQTSESTISERLSQIDEQVKSLRSEASTLKNKIEAVQDQRDQIQAQRRRKDDLEREINELQLNLEENESRLSDLEANRKDVMKELETLRESMKEEDSRLTDIESEIKYKQRELEEKREELERLQGEAENREQLQAQLNKLTAKIESLRSRRNEKKRELAERFEETMTDIITTFELGFESARLAPQTDAEGEITDYELIIAREGQETSLEALSEGEVELLGIVTALAGYETFNVSDRAPVILLDGLTALSKDNYEAMIEYLRGITDCLVTTAYPEIDEFDGHIINPYDWDVVSNQQTSSA